MKHIAIAALTSLALAAGDPLLPAPEPYADEYVLVRKDVWDRVDADSRKLEVCEPALKKAQNGMEQLQDSIEEHQDAIDELNAQKKLLDHHISILEGLVDVETDTSSVAEDIWEWVDGPVHFGTGVGMCIGMAWVLNQPGIRAQ